MAKCGGCEAATPEYEEFSDGEFIEMEYDGPIEATNSSEWSTGIMAAFPAFEGDHQGDLYGVIGFEMEAISTNGSCNADCTEETSCAFDITVILEVLVVSDDPNATGPALFFDAPWTAASDDPPDIRTSDVEGYDPVDALYTIITTHEWVSTVQPGCDGAWDTFTITDGDFSVDAATGGSATKEASSGDSDVQIRVKCETCDGSASSLSSVTQSTGKNLNIRSIENA